MIYYDIPKIPKLVASPSRSKKSPVIISLRLGAACEGLDVSISNFLELSTVGIRPKGLIGQ